MKVIAVTGEIQACERLLETLTCQGSVATITYGDDEKHVFARETAKRVLHVRPLQAMRYTCAPQAAYVTL